MSLQIIDNFARQTRFWDLPDLDPTDLAVAVAGDLCERRINPYDYIPYCGAWNRLNLIRPCLALGREIDEIRDLNDSQLLKLIDSDLAAKVPEHVIGDARSRAYYLKTRCFLPFAACNPHDCLEVNHTTMFPFPEDLDELANKLMIHFDFYQYKFWLWNGYHGRIEY